MRRDVGWIRGLALTVLVMLLSAPFGLAAAAAPGQGGSAVTQQPAVIMAGADKASMLAVARAGRRIVAVGEHGIVLLSDDDGATFRQARAVPTRTTLNSVTFVDDKEGWIAGHWGVVLHTTDGGETWAIQRQDLNVDQPLFAVYFADKQNGFAAGLWSLMLATHDGGQSWSPIALPPPKGADKADKNLYQILSNGKGLLVLATEQGYVYRSEDSGRTWTVVESGNPGSFWTGLFLDDGSILLGGLRGALYRSTDGGLAWTSLDSGTKSSITGLADLPDGTIVAVALDGVTAVSKDHGKSFTASQREDRLSLNAITVNAGGRPVIASGQGMQPGS